MAHLFKEKTDRNADQGVGAADPLIYKSAVKRHKMIGDYL